MAAGNVPQTTRGFSLDAFATYRSSGRSPVSCQSAREVLAPLPRHREARTYSWATRTFGVDPLRHASTHPIRINAARSLLAFTDSQRLMRLRKLCQILEDF